MSVSKIWWLFVLAVLMLAGAVGFAVAPESNAGFKEAGAVIAFATMLAVGIERAFEVCWTLVDQAKSLGAYWPMSVIKPQIEAIEEQTNAVFTKIVAPATKALEDAKKQAGGDQARLERIDAALARLESANALASKRVKDATALAPGSTRIANVVGATDMITGEVRDALQGAGAMTAEISKALSMVELHAGTALDIIATFKDNPARRLTSLVLGAAVGAIVAGFVGVNLFAAIDAGTPAALGGKLGVLITGLVIGLGSGPTHELVKGLQSVKKARQTVSVGGGSGDVGGGTSVGVDALATGVGRRRVVIRATD